MPKSGITKKASIPRIERRTNPKPFAVAPFPLGLKRGVDPDKISQFGDEICNVEKMRKSLR
jgi:hypothetical protein